jgi:hypothetical protein
MNYLLPILLTCIPAELKKGNNMVKYEKARLEEGNS